MAQSNLLRLRNLWFQVHKWIGLILAVLIIPLSLSGAALVWDEALDRALNPQRYQVGEGPLLAPGAYAAVARSALQDGERLVSIRLPQDRGPVVATASPAPRGAARPGPPTRINLYLDPATGRPIERASSNSGPIRFLHVLHGSLQIPAVGRTLVGWIGIFMLLSSLTGLWLWWPLRGRVLRGLRWNRQPAFSANLHHQLGFWIALPLAMLSFTGAWIAFPGLVGPLVGEKPAGGDRMRATRARPVEAPRTSLDAAVAAAGGAAGLVSITWPTDQSPVWRVQKRGGGEIEVADESGIAAAPKPARPEPLSRTMRRWHDGTGMGPVWQTLIFLGGIFPAVLAVTGILMWLRTRGWRGRIRSRQAEAKARAAA